MEESKAKQRNDERRTENAEEKGKQTENRNDN